MALYLDRLGIIANVHVTEREADWWEQSTYRRHIPH
jgi:hypothetical protein